MQQVLVTWGPAPVDHNTILTALHTLERHGGHIKQIFELVQAFLAMGPQAAIDAAQDATGTDRPHVEYFAYTPRAAHLLPFIFKRPLTTLSPHRPLPRDRAP
ncbi:hypothetical protein MMC30_005943 [Trapelia coarctata]|nr:hypothetical protein [Trapelia coarctata]